MYGFGSKDLISAFGSGDLLVWVCISGVRSMGLGPRIFDLGLWI